MYRIELGPDDVGVFRSLDEMVTAIKSGVITPKARIYHQATDKWLPIEFHPHYRKALEMAASAVAPAQNASPASPSPAPVIPGASGPVLTAAAASGVALVVEESEPEPFAGATGAAPDHAFVELHTLGDAAAHDADSLEIPQDVEAGAPSVAHIPLLRLSISAGRPRRPFLIALSGMALVFSTNMGLEAAPPPWGLHLAIPGVAHFGGEHASNADAAAAAPAQPSVAQPAPTGVPSFGTNSAFAAASVGAGSKISMSAAAAMAAAARAEAARIALAPDRGLAASTAAAARGATRAGISSDSAAKIPTPTADTSGIAPAPTATIAAGAVHHPGSGSERMSPSVLVTHYQAAYAAARAELDMGLRTAGFADLFAPSRLQSAEEVRAARLSVGTAAAYITKYRRREAEIEAAYADSSAALGRELNWTNNQVKVWENRKARRESPEMAKLTASLLASLDSVYGILAAHPGAYSLGGGTLTFDDSAAARAYAELRPSLDRSAVGGADSADGAPTTAGRVFRAIGPSPLPKSAGD
ncbi:MAG TPA: hypothetical protein VFW66_11715 [Gemmatimonadales bacterium]|nr:hypothetical protein [Gemmatimonadales bacterium]